MGRKVLSKSLGKIEPKVLVENSLVGFAEVETECGALTLVPTVMKNPTGSGVTKPINSTVYTFD